MGKVSTSSTRDRITGPTNVQYVGKASAVNTISLGIKQNIQEKSRTSVMNVRKALLKKEV